MFDASVLVSSSIVASVDVAECGLKREENDTFAVPKDEMIFGTKRTIEKAIKRRIRISPTMITIRAKRLDLLVSSCESSCSM